MNMPDRPLIVFTSFGPASSGLILSAMILSRAGYPDGLVLTLSLGALALALVALSGSIVHLEKPARAYRALRGFPASPLSREVVFFGIYLAALAVFSASLMAGAPAETGWAVAVVGLAATISSAQVYLLPARPSWNSPATVIRFVAGGISWGAAATLTASFAWGGTGEAWAAPLLTFLGLAGVAAAVLATRQATPERLRTLSPPAPGASAPGRSERDHVRDQDSYVFYRYGRLGIGGLLPIAALAVSFLSEPAVGVALAGITVGEVSDRRLFFSASGGLPAVETARHSGSRHIVPDHTGGLDR